MDLHLAKILASNSCIINSTIHSRVGKWEVGVGVIDLKLLYITNTCICLVHALILWFHYFLSISLHSTARKYTSILIYYHTHTLDHTNLYWCAPVNAHNKHFVAIKNSFCFHMNSWMMLAPLSYILIAFAVITDVYFSKLLIWSSITATGTFTWWCVGADLTTTVYCQGER